MWKLVFLVFGTTFLLTDLFAGFAYAQPGGATIICGGCFQMDTPATCNDEEVLTPACQTSYCAFAFKDGVFSIVCSQLIQTAYVPDNDLGAIRVTAPLEIGRSCFDYVERNCTEQYLCECINGATAYDPCVTNLIGPTSSPALYRDYFLSGATCQD